MVSSKGKPTDQKLHDEVAEKVKNETNKDGSGKGQMAAWKANKIAKDYEAQGGGYENEAGSKNEPKKGAPEHKTDSKKATEAKETAKEDAKDTEAPEEAEAGKAEKPKANIAKKAKGKGDAKTKAPRAPRAKREEKVPAEGTRKSSRVSEKRSAPAPDKKEEAPAKKSKVSKN